MYCGYYRFDATYLLVIVGLVLSLAASLLQLLRLIILSGGRRRK